MTAGDFDCVSCGWTHCSSACYPTHKRRFACHNPACFFHPPLAVEAEVAASGDEDGTVPAEETPAMPPSAPSGPSRLRAHPPPARVEIWIQNAHYEPSRRRSNRREPSRDPIPTLEPAEPPARPADPPAAPAAEPLAEPAAEVPAEPPAEPAVEDTPANLAADENGDDIESPEGGAEENGEESEQRGGGVECSSLGHSSSESSESDTGDTDYQLDRHQPSWTVISLENVPGDEAERRRGGRRRR